MSITSKCALILPGAVAKGAFEAGVIEVLAQKQIQIDRICLFPFPLWSQAQPQGTE